MIRVSNLRFAYSSLYSISFPDFEVKNGEHFLMLGESGSGKTTLLHLLGGLLRGYEGTIQVSNTELSSLSESQLDHFRGKNLGFIFQRNHLIRALSVEKNLLMAPFLAELPQDKKRMHEVLEELGIEDRSKSMVTHLSYGQAQRVAIARAVINHPSVILADEPTSALDDKNCDRVINLLLSVAAHNNSTLVVATHDQRVKGKIANHIQLRSSK